MSVPSLQNVLNDTETTQTRNAQVHAFYGKKKGNEKENEIN